MLRILRGSLALAVLLAATQAAAEAVRPPKSPFADAIPDDAPKASIDLVRKLRLGSYSALFEETRLDEIRDHAGIGHSDQAGDASEFTRWYCYALPGALMWLESGEMGGGDRLTSVAAESTEPSDPRRPSCPALPESLTPATLEFGWLGTPRATLERALGEPSLVRGDWLAFYYFGQKRGPYQGPGDATPREVEFDVVSSVEVRIRDGIVAELRAEHVTSY
jgi:hypothetical protein